jgi:hypothetical protein
VKTPRILAFMGSGETAPTMVTPHREIVARLGDDPRAVLLDTPYGFQENGPEITQRAIEYFAKRVQLTIDAVGYPGPLAADPAQRSAGAEAAALARLRTANLIFAGPGSPSYALSVWRGSPIPEALVTRITEGAALVFASAAALTLGKFTIPVYEIYKSGQSVHWLEGLDLPAKIGFEGSCVVIPHYDNAEGGTHDTRFCYLGERRLAMMEAMLPDDAWVLGVDEHTAVIMDLDARTVTVSGRGGLTVRRRGTSRTFAAGEQLTFDTLQALARGETSAPKRSAAPSAGDAASTAGTAAAPAPAAAGAANERSPLLAEANRLEQAFGSALESRKAGDAAEAILHLDRTIQEWAADSLQTDEPDRARAILHSLIARLGEAAAAGVRDPRERLAPLVESLITLRKELRAAKAYELADRVRDRLIAAHIEIRDTPAGTEWDLRE